MRPGRGGDAHLPIAAGCDQHDVIVLAELHKKMPREEQRARTSLVKTWRDHTASQCHVGTDEGEGGYEAGRCTFAVDMR